MRQKNFRNSNQEKLHFSNAEAIIYQIDVFFLGIDKRALKITLLRWQENKSLEEIGKRFNITRERVRQITHRLLTDLIKSFKLDINDIRGEILNQIIQRPKPLLHTQLFTDNSKSIFTAKFYTRIICSIIPEAPFELNLIKNKQNYFNRLGEKDEALVIFRLLEGIEWHYKKYTFDSFVSYLKSLGLDLKSILLAIKILFSLSSYRIILIEKKYYIIRIEKLPSIVQNILESSDVPLHIDEISLIINRDYKSKKFFTSKSLLSLINRTSSIYTLDWHTFGLSKHFSYPREKWKEINEYAKTILRASEKQIYVGELLDKIRPIFPNLKSKYELVHILRSDVEIVDLKFFTFSLAESGLKSRIKLKDVIHKIYKEDPRVRHYLEIQNEISQIRHVRVEGLNIILKNIPEIIKYPGSFYGLKHLDQININSLSKDERFISNYLSSVLFPNTKTSQAIEFFNNDDNKINCIRIIKTSKFLREINSASDIESFVISIDWSLLKLIKCILFNYHRPMYLTEIKWILDELNIPNEYFMNNKHKIYDDDQIIKKDNMLEYFDYDFNIDRDNELIDIFYELLLETKITFSFQDFISEFKDDLTNEGLDENKLRAILQEDERFIITNEIIMVRS